ncbi:Aste57867_23560 [Aphanomyces stellatus]|uniref:Aste57867_23560 protein n=1 Tax=Aphanomyces stellatus TaxID=120398 RepID=A0A485LN05_9STRA|nr:hypothetical protein As57867_023489 [Aphanomyces stellatus]VFU00205.1 Aste57867_23560 [Aphanomyces stellatus]
MASSARAQHIGDSNHLVTEDCEALKQQLDALWIDKKQMNEGIVGGVVTQTACKALHDLSVMDYRTDKEQEALCANPCYNNTAATYAAMLNLNCFTGVDEFEVANQRLFAASFQLGCQQDKSKKYCVPLIGLKVLNAGGTYDMCSDIVNKIGCCFESYRRYMQFGTQRSIDELKKVHDTCASHVSDIDVPCGCNPGNAYATPINKTKVCGRGKLSSRPCSWLTHLCSGDTRSLVGRARDAAAPGRVAHHCMTMNSTDVDMFL